MLARNTVLALGLVPASAAFAGAGVHTVPGEFPSIQAAVNAAVDGDEIIVANGTWGDFDVADKLLLIKSASNDPLSCTVSSFSVAAYISGSAQVTLRGMTLTTGGSARGVQIDDTAFAALQNCRIHNNGLGGVVAQSTEGLVMEDCVVTQNSDTEDGGGIRVLAGFADLRGCHLEGNSASGVDTRGGALYMASPETLILNGCRFVDNTVSGSTAGKGAGLFTTLDTADVLIEDCEFETNTAQTGGGGIFLQRSAVIRNTTFLGNNAQAGGAILAFDVSNLNMVNCLVDDNDVTGNTGGVRLSGGSFLFAECCTFVRNSAGSGGGAIGGPAGNTATVRSSILYHNTPNAIAGTGTFNVSWSTVQGGWSGSSNSSANPLLGAPFSGNPRLSASSPAIDAGRTDLYIGPPVDRDSLPRAVDDPDKLDTGVAAYGVAIDQGAFEYQPAPPVDTCPSDITNDDETDVDDLVEVIVNWGICP